VINTTTKILKTKILIICCLLHFSISFATNETQIMGAKSSAMANSSVMLYDLWGIHNNQAGIAQLSGISLGFSNERRFTDEQDIKALAAAFGTKHGTFGLNITHFGFSQYYEQKFGLAYAKGFGNRLSVGLQLDYLNLFIGDIYGNTGTITFETGMIYSPVKNLFIGAHVYNPARIKISEDIDETLSTVFRFGMGYYFLDRVLLTAEAEKDIDYKPDYKTGIQYMVYDEVFIRAGVASNPFKYSFGLGFGIIGAMADVSFAHIDYLGYVPQISISYNFTSNR